MGDGFFKAEVRSGGHQHQVVWTWGDRRDKGESDEGEEGFNGHLSVLVRIGYKLKVGIGLADIRIE